MVVLRTVGLGFVAMVLSMTPAPAAETPQALSLAVGAALENKAEAIGTAQAFDPGVAQGSYVKGQLRVATGRFDLDLVDASGRHLRRLADGARGTVEFQFMAETPDDRLIVTGREPGTYALTLDRLVTRADQLPAAPTYLSPTIAGVAETVAAGKATDGFWAMVEAQGTPLVEAGEDGRKIVTFLGRGAQRNIRLFGAPSGDHEELQQLAGSHIWFKSFDVPDGTRLSYQLAFDVPDVPGTARDRRIAILATAKADPLNRHPWPAKASDAYNQDSVLELEGAPPQPWLAENGNPTGTLKTLSIESEVLGNRRDITIYRPAGFDPARKDTILLFVFDADQYLERVPVPRMLDNMIAAGAVPPVVAVFVANPDRAARARELPANPAFADFMAVELYPLVVKETGVAVSAARTVLAGSSYGGLAAATVAMRHPEVFGNVLSMSGSFWWSPPGTPEDRREHVAGLIAAGGVLPLRFFLAAGLFETGAHGTAGILDTSRHLRDVLQAKGIPVTYRDYAGGHDYLVWQGVLPDGLIALFGGDRP
ncbi:alpha/beta hydrolase-fold protein [Shinella sp. CPCC 101442]|uniref:alpha/beta hydrolase-fold protein n=1 Tax=Shinella sp. CPCC 101442 TaxID=2932265 RepID=UPI00215340A3|nr:alpha/beta hydrolase-fold protein [Shinella sp. CPCC 101442]MCR6497892.1 alpha/beta hydrolase-fold protein [Shinella sp. CPCC 101442]